MDWNAIQTMMRLQNLFSGNPNDTTIRLPSTDFTQPYKPSEDFRKPFQNIDFGVNDITDMNPPVNMVEQEDEFTPEFGARDRFEQIMKEMPVRPEYPLWRRLLIGGLAGLAGQPLAGREALESGHERKLRDWKLKLDPAERLLLEERAANREERMFGHQARQSKIAQQRADTYDQRVADQAKLGQERLELDRQKLELARFKHDNPNWVIKEVRGGNITAINPQDPSKVFDTGIASGMLSDLEKHNLGVERDLTRIGAQHQANVGMEGIRQTNREAMVPLREASQSRLIKERESNIRTRPTRSGSSSASNQARETVNRARKFRNENPDLARYVKIDGLDVQITPPSTGGILSRGPSKEQHQRILQAVEGTASPTNQDQQIIDFLKKNGKAATLENIEKVKAQLARRGAK